MTVPADSLAISVIIVNWNSGGLLGENLASLELHNDLSAVEVIVVDNGSADGSLAEAAAFPWVRVFRLGENRGFAAACNLGARAAQAPLLLFLNPDIKHTPDNLARLAGPIASRPEAAGVCGSLEDETGRKQRGFQLRLNLTPGWGLLELLLPPSHWCAWPWLRRYFYADHDWSQAFPVEQPAAACLLLRRAAFEQLGGFDEAFQPAWLEDVDLCRRLSDRGLSLWYIPDVSFRHVGGYSLRQIGQAAFKTHFWRNSLRYFRKHYPGFAWVYRWLLPPVLAWRALLALRCPERSGIYLRLAWHSLFWGNLR